MIVVTDSVERLNNYIESDQDAQLLEYINNNLKHIVVLNAQNIREELPKVNGSQVVLMTTQRYFRMSVQELNAWAKSHKRIIIDEKPPILESRRIDVQLLNEVDTAIKQGLDDTINTEDKQSMLDLWHIITSYLWSELRRHEEKNKGYQLESYFFINQRKADQIRDFFALFDKYRVQLGKVSPSIQQTVGAVARLMQEGVIVSQKRISKQSANTYNNYFTVVINNVELLTDVDARILILDGTADISPEYLLNCFEIIDCSAFKRDLSALTINIVDFKTSKGAFQTAKKGGKDAALANAIADYLNSLPQMVDVVFSYVDNKHLFQGRFSFDWFGAIKGKNNYRELHNIAQIGLNRFPDSVYRLYASEISHYNDSDEGKLFTCRNFEPYHIAHIRSLLILSDIEQNMFRCRIRNADNKEPCTYTIITAHAETIVNPDPDLFGNLNKSIIDDVGLIALIKKRYEPLGATVSLIETPRSLAAFKTLQRNGNRDSIASRIFKWLADCQPGYMFHINEMLSSLGINQRQFQKAKENNADLRKAFANMKQRKGVYMT